HGLLARRVHRVRCSQPTRRFQLVVAYIYRNDLARPKGFSDLDNVGTHTTGANHGYRLIGLHAGLVLHRTIGRHHGAAEDAGVRQWHTRGGWKHITGRDHRILGQAAHAIHGQGRAITAVQTAAAIVQRAAQAVHGKERFAQVIAPTHTVVTHAARHDEATDHRVSRLRGLDVSRHRLDHTSNPMPQDTGARELHFGL